MRIEELYNLFEESAGITTDSRKVSDGELFFALKGESFDGNKFALQAVQKGALGAIVDDPSVVTDRMILVDDVLRTLQELSTYHREKLGLKVLAITGTNGKTTTKELLASVLSKKFRVHSTKGNLNNQIGVPLTILSAPYDTELMIVEMGASRPGDIKELCEIAKPDFGTITNIGKAHIAGFGDINGVISTKTELYRYLKLNGGTVFYNDNDKVLSDQINLTDVNAITFSSINGSDLTIETVQVWPTLVLDLGYGGSSFRMSTKLFGEYNMENIKSAVAIGLYFGAGIDGIVDAIESYTPSNNRSQVLQTPSNTLICDAYNANPVSMREAIKSFLSVRADNKVCVLGDMLELGVSAIQEHKDILDLLDNCDLRVILIGGVFSLASSNSGFLSFKDVNDAELYLKKEKIRGATILLKGSRGIGLERLYKLF